MTNKATTPAPAPAQLPPEKPDAKAVAELQGRIKALNDELIPLLGKYELALAAQPIILNDGRMGAKPIVLDARKLPAPENTPTDPSRADAPPPAGKAPSQPSGKDNLATP